MRVRNIDLLNGNWNCSDSVIFLLCHFIIFSRLFVFSLSGSLFFPIFLPELALWKTRQESHEKQILLIPGFFVGSVLFIFLVFCVFCCCLLCRSLTFLLYAQCCQCLWIVHSRSPLRVFLTFIYALW